MLCCLRKVKETGFIQLPAYLNRLLHNILILFETSISTIHMLMNSMNWGLLMMPMRLRCFRSLFDPVSLSKSMERLLIDKILTFLGPFIIKDGIGRSNMCRSQRCRCHGCTIESSGNRWFGLVGVQWKSLGRRGVHFRCCEWGHIHILQKTYEIVYFWT